MVYPQDYNNPYEEEPKSVPEIIIGNILKAVVCIFLIVIGFFIVILMVATINGQTAIEYTTYTHDFQISNPLLAQTIYTSNRLLSSITITKYNSSNASYGGVPSTYWSYDDTTSAVTITGGLEHTITSIRVSANTDYSDPPVESVMTAWAFALVIMCLAGVFGIIAWKIWG